jgi:hypothetical protein
VTTDDLDLNSDFTDRTCPICGKVEPVSTNTILWAREQGLPDEWVCWACFIKRECEMPRKLVK